MNNFNLTISTENASLATLTGRRYTKGLTNYTFDELATVSKNTVGALKMLYKVVKGEDPAGDAVAMSVKSEDGAFKRFYGPTLCKNENGLLLFFGNESINFTVSKKGVFVPTVPLPESIEVKLSFEKTKLNGYDELAFKVSIFNEATDTLITFSLPFRVEDVNILKNMTADTLQSMLDRKLTDLIALIGEIPQGGSSDFEGPMLKLGQLDLDTYLITDYRAAKPGGRLTFILQIEGLRSPDGEPLQSFYKEAGGSINGGETEPLVKAQVWANFALVSFFATEPNITPETPAELLIRHVKKSVNGYTVDAAVTHDTPSTVSVTEEDLDFNF